MWMHHGWYHGAQIADCLFIGVVASGGPIGFNGFDQNQSQTRKMCMTYKASFVFISWRGREVIILLAAVC